MPPTLTTKSSPDINKPRFAIITKALAGETDEQGHRRFRAVASSSVSDRAGDEISLKALQQMRDKFRDGVTIFTDHENKVFNAFGRTDTAEIVQSNALDPKTGTPIWDLTIGGPVNEPNPNAVQLHESISGGYVQLGCSIDAFVLDHEIKKSGGMAIEGLDVYAASIVGVPMQQRAWTQKALRAIKSFYGEPEPAEEEDGLPPLTITKEQVPEKDTTAGVAADPATPATPDASAAGEANEEAKEDETKKALEGPADTIVGEDGPENVAVLSACPECGQSAETTGCDNGYHTAATAAADESTEGVQEALEATPDTAPSDEAETDPATEQKAASLSPEVSELLHHVETLVKEIGRQRDEIERLTKINTTLEDEKRIVFGEVELAKQVIGKVMEQPLQSKTAAFVSDFTDNHSLFGDLYPEVADYLRKRGA